MNTSAKFEVPVEKLRWQCRPELFDFDCTKDLAPLREFIGQDRAIRAIEFGLSMENDGYNVFVAGLSGTGKTSIVKSYIERTVARDHRADMEHPGDWCYVHNFTDIDRPQAISMPQGGGRPFRDRLNTLLDKLKENLSIAFNSDEYKSGRKKVVDEAQEKQQGMVQQITEEARRQGFLLEMTPVGPALVPIVQDRAMTQAEYMALDENTRKELDRKRVKLLAELQSTMEKLQNLQHETMQKMENADKSVADTTVTRLFQDVLRDYESQPKVVQYLNELKKYSIENPEIFKEEQDKTQTMFGLSAAQIMQGRDPYLPFRVNVFVDNSETKGPPVITEANPIYPNLFGKTERRFLFGGYLSDHTSLKAGAIDRANGGYLLLSAMEVLTNPGVWPALKRSIRTKESKIEDPYEQFGLIAPQGMKPEPIPLNIKIFLMGDPNIYRLLAQFDEEFWELFRVKADFDYEINKTTKNINEFAAFVSGCCEDCKLVHFDRTGVAKVLEFSSRMVDDQKKLSSRFSQIKDLVQEASYWAKKDGAKNVAAKHVEQAVEERRFRHNLPDERIKEMIERGTIMIDTQGEAIGQVNGLSVYSLGDISFGKPSRITCRTFLGRHGIINIERESELSGPIHNKGVFILSGYLGDRFAKEIPLSLSASLCFEQSYEGVEGDSASSTELYALLSSLAQAPIRQDIAVTGSVNQKGEVQPIGGINQKIEGFFGVCKAKGLTGTQGVMMPARNLDNLMLRQEVLEAVKAGQFHIWAVNTIDEGIEILTGIPMGDQKDGAWPENTISYRVDRMLRNMAEKLKQYASPMTIEETDGHKKARVPAPVPSRQLLSL